MQSAECESEKNKTESTQSATMDEKKEKNNKQGKIPTRAIEIIFTNKFNNKYRTVVAHTDTLTNKLENSEANDERHTGIEQH